MTDSNAAFRDEALALVEQVVAAKDEIAITVMCNRRTHTRPIVDFGDHSVVTEFLSDQELNEILGGYRSEGLMISAVLDEFEFLSHVLSNQAPERRHQVLMNLDSARLGPWGKALVPALAEATGWIITNSNAYSVGLAKHKFHWNAILNQIGILAPRNWCYSRQDGWLAPGRPPDGVTVLVQPAFESASIGLDDFSRINASALLDSYCHRTAEKFKQDVVVREFISGYEVEVPVVRLERSIALEPIGIALDGDTFLKDRYLTYATVLENRYRFYAFRETGAPELITQLQATAERACTVLGLRGFARVDFRINADDHPFVIDIAASPHFTTHSSFAEAAQLVGLPRNHLSVLLTGLALRRESVI